MYPQGWLIDPNGRWLLFFHKDPIYLGKWPKIYMDKWSASEMGTPQSLQNRRKVELEPALETWNELIQSGWKQIHEQFGEAA